MLNKIGIIGVGSPWGADKIAQHVIELLKAHFDEHLLSKEIQLAYYDRPGFYLLDCLSHFDLVHLIDAMVSGQAEGTLHRYDDITVFKKNNHCLSTHGLGVADVLVLGDTVQCLPEKIIIHGIEIDKDHPLAALNDSLLRACQRLADNIIVEISA